MLSESLMSEPSHVTMTVQAKLAALSAALLAGVVLLFASAAPVSAHPGHDHGTVAPTVSATRTGARIEAEALAPARRATVPVLPLHEPGVEMTDGPAKPVQPSQHGNCCCGSIACHTGVEAPAIDISDPFRFAQRVDPPPVRDMAKV